MSPTIHHRHNISFSRHRFSIMPLVSQVAAPLQAAAAVATAATVVKRPIRLNSLQKIHFHRLI